MVMLYKKISKVPFTKCRLAFRARVVTDEDVLSEHNQDWRLNRMKQITDRRVYVRIAKQIAKQTGKKRKVWPLSRSKCKMRVYTKEVNGRNVPMGVDVYWAPSWRRLKDIQNSAEFALCFFTRTRVKRDSLKEWGPGDGFDNFGILKFSDAKFIRVDKDTKTHKYVEFYQIQWEPTRIRRRDFDRFPVLKDDLLKAYDKAMTEYKQIVRPGRKQEPRRARAGRSVGVVQFQAPIAPIAEGHANVEPLAQPAGLDIDLPPHEGQLGLGDIEEQVELVNQGEGVQNEERENQFDLAIVEDDVDDDDEPGRLIIDLPQEEDEQSDLEDQEPANIVINQGQFGFEMQQNEPRQNGPLLPVLAPKPISEARTNNPAVHEPEQTKKPIAVQLERQSGPQVPVLASKPIGEDLSVNPAVHEPEPIEPQVDDQLEHSAGPQVPVLALEPMIEANPVNPAVHEPEQIKQPTAVQLVQHSGPVVPVLALEPMIKANPVNPAVHEPEPIEPQVDDQLEHSAGPQVPVLALEPMIEANPVNPAVHEPEPIERQISVQLDHRSIDQYDIGDHEPGQLIIDLPQNQNQEEQFNIENVVENEQEQVQGQQGLIIDAPQIQDPADPLGLQNIDFGDVDNAELVINRFRDVGLVNQVDLENRENGEQDTPGELVNDLSRIDDPEAQANRDKQDGMDQRAGQPQHEMAHEQIEPVLPVPEQIVQQDGQQQQVIAPEPVNEENPVNVPGQIGVPIAPQIGEQDAFDDYYEQMERQIEQRLAQLYDDNQDHACTSIYSNWAHYVPEPEEDPPYEYVAQLLRYWLEPNYGYILEFIVRERREPLTQVQRDNIILWHRLRD